MRHPLRWLSALVLTVALFVAVEASRTKRPVAEPDVVKGDDAAGVPGEGSEGLGREALSTLPPPPPPNYAQNAELLRESNGLTYIEETLAARSGHIARWIDRTENPITVWIQKSSPIKDFWPDYPERARDAFYAWVGTGIPLKFLFVDDSASAEVHVRWVDRFTDLAAGKTYWSRDKNWWIVAADIEIAVHRPSGEPYEREAIRTIALHEVGHTIGLDHCNNLENVMAPRVRVVRLSSEDMRTAALVYKLPPGAVRPPPKD